MATVAEVLKFKPKEVSKGRLLFQTEARGVYEERDVFVKEFRSFYAPENPGTLLVGPERGSMEGLRVVSVYDVTFAPGELPTDDDPE